MVDGIRFDVRWSDRKSIGNQEYWYFVSAFKRGTATALGAGGYWLAWYVNMTFSVGASNTAGSMRSVSTAGVGA